MIFLTNAIIRPKGLRSAGGPKLLKWGLPGRGFKSAKVRPTPYVYYPPVGGAGCVCSSAEEVEHSAGGSETCSGRVAGGV